MCFQDAEGRARGFAVDVLNEAAARAGVRLTWVRAGTPATNDEALRRGQLDLIPTGLDSPDRRRQFYVSEPWWSAEMVAVASAAGPVTSEAALVGRRVAMIGLKQLALGDRYRSSVIVHRLSAVQATEAVCAGEADAAVFANMFVRELLFTPSSACAGVSLRIIDMSTRVDYRLVARTAVEASARRLRDRLDDLTADGTLGAIAARHPPVSTPHATRMAEMLRARYEQRVSGIELVAASLIILVGGVGIFLLYRSRVRLGQANSRLEEDLASHARMEAALRESEKRFRELLDSAPETVLAVDHSGKIAFANARCEQMFGWTADEIIGTSVDSLVPSRVRASHAELRSAFFTRPRPQTVSGDKSLRALRKDGAEFPVEVSLGRIESNGQTLALAFVRDVSERMTLEAQLRQAQKMEAVGQLAGGVAHDFNNLLTVITGYSTLALEAVGPEHELHAALTEIGSAADRATALTRQLLAFSRRQPFQPQVVALNDVIGRMEKMLRRLIGEHIELCLTLAPDAGQVRVDPTLIEQVILNLAVNARDAMPDGGNLRIETARKPAQGSDSGTAPDVELMAQTMLAVTDTGTGIPEGIREHLFEPFFTTKPAGRGTGLGLATVYGIVKQAEGSITVESEVGKGTTFRVFFPSMAAQPAVETGLAENRPRGGTETILLVEDEDGVRSFVRELLESHGYRVLAAEGAEEALRLSESEDRTIDLLLTDVVMPGMNGAELAQTLSAKRPGLPVLFMSGYTGAAFAIPNASVQFVQKPFTPRVLLNRIRSILEIPHREL